MKSYDALKRPVDGSVKRLIAAPREPFVIEADRNLPLSYFERGLTDVAADYSLRDKGGVNVLNRGYSADADRWKEARGKAYFVKGTDVGFLKVSFFGPFYGSYIIFGLDRRKQPQSGFAPSYQ